MHWLYRDVLIKTRLINQIKQTIKNLIRILKEGDTTLKLLAANLMPPLAVLAYFSKIHVGFLQTHILNDWNIYKEIATLSTDRRGPGQFLARMRSRDGTKWERRGEMIKTARSYYRRSIYRYIEKLTRKEKGRNDRFQVCAVIITCQKIGNHGQSFIWNGINLMPSPEIVMRSRNIK